MVDSAPSTLCSGSTPFCVVTHVGKSCPIEEVKEYKIARDARLKSMHLNEFACDHHPRVLRLLEQAIVSSLLSNYDTHERDGELLSAIREKLFPKVSGVTEEGILLVNGADQGIKLLLHCAAPTSVIIPGPTYGQYERYARMFGMQVFPCEYTETLQAVDDALLNSQRQGFMRTVCILCNPNNPVGSPVLSKTIASLAKKYPAVTFLIDESYMEYLLFSRKQHEGSLYESAVLLNDMANIIVLRTFSKAFGLAGMRIAYLLGRPSTIKALRNFFDHKNVTELSKLAAVAVLNHLDYYKTKAQSTSTLAQNAARTLNESGINAVYNGTNFFCIISSYTPNLLMSLRAKGIEAWPRAGIANAKALPLRITVTNKTDVQQAVDIITKLLSKHA